MRVWFLLAVALATTAAKAGDWPQFRGPNSLGLAVGEVPLPADIAPDRHVVWKTPLPPGHSSPVVSGSRIFVTAVRDKDRLVTIGLDRNTGSLLWEQEAPHGTVELIHSIGSLAQCTAATDGERVVALFGSCGLFCYDVDGQLLWKKPMGPFKNDFGAGSSPIIVDDYVILAQDHDVDGFLAALDKRTGEQVWSTPRSEFTRSYGTPLIWDVGGQKQIVIAGTLRVAGYDLKTGRELWTVREIARFVSATPVVGGGRLYVTGFGKGGDEGDRLVVEEWEKGLLLDKDQNGTVERSELPKDHTMEPRFVQVDRDKNGSLTKVEWEFFRRLLNEGRNSVIAVKPGATGEATQSHRLWEQRRYVPFCASPLYHDGVLFTVRDKGIFASLDAATGALHKEGRVAGTADYYSSPVYGDGKVYLLDQRGKLTVLKAAAEWETLAKADFGEDAYATPAIVDGRIYLRTNGHLYSFGIATQ